LLSMTIWFYNSHFNLTLPNCVIWLNIMEIGQIGSLCSWNLWSQTNSREANKLC
jgi:hypothetical protein